MEEKYLTKQEAAELLRISVSSLDRYALLGKIKKTKIGGRVLYKKSDLI